MNQLKLSAQQILDTSSAEELYTSKNWTKEFSKLRIKWHPDKNPHPKSSDVFAHISKLAEEAERKSKSNSWAKASEIQFDTQTGKTYKFSYKQMVEIEVGKMYIGVNTVVFVFDNGFEDLFDNGIKNIKSIKFPNAKMEKEFKWFKPTVLFSDNKTTIGPVAVFRKPTDSVLLQNLINYHDDKKIESRHTAWIGGALFNIATLMDHLKICHNSITPNTVFVDTKNHAVHLVGGWWYSTKADEKLKAIPSELTKILPTDLFNDKISKTKYDRFAIKGVVMACMGDPSMVGSKLLKDKEIPKLMLSWIRSPANDEALSDYKGWTKVVEQSYGKRKFVEYETLNDVY